MPTRLVVSEHSAAKLHVVPAQDGAAESSGDLERSARHERELIEAAIAVNEAPTLDAALSVLAETGLSLLEADRVSIVVWDEGLARGVIRAVAGEGVRYLGVEIRPGTNSSFRAAQTGQPVLDDPDKLGGLGPELAYGLSEHACRISVPHLIEGLPPVTFQAAWRLPRPPAEAERSISTLRTLGSLTRIAYRADEERGHERDQARLDAVLDSVGDGLFLLTPDRRIANLAARRLLALPDEHVPPPQLFKPRTLEGRLLTEEELPSRVAWRTGYPRKTRLRVTSLAGVELVLEVCAAPIRVEDGDPIGSVTVFRDITEEHNRDLFMERLRHQLFDALPTAVGIADPETRRLLSVNRAFLELTGYEAEEAIGLTPPHPWWEDPLDFERTEWAPAEGPGRFETRFRRKDGTIVPVEIVRFVVRDSEDTPAATVHLITDLSERRRFEQQLVQSGKLAAIGELAAGVAHEINNPLFAILGLVEFLLQDLEAGTKAHDRLLLVQRTGLEIKEIVHALLDFARERWDERATVSLADVARQTVELVRRTSLAKDVEIVERYGADPCFVEGSPNQLKQILLNLLSNAQQAMPKGGMIALALERDGDWAVATVSDTGPGISEDVLPRIFEPFYTTKRELGGTGLGLSVSLSIAHRHGGDLSVDAQPGEGASFSLRLPRAGDAE